MMRATRSTRGLLCALAIALAFVSSGAAADEPTTFTPPYSYKTTTEDCSTFQRDADCSVVPSADATTGAVAVDVTVSSGERATGYGTGFGTAQVMRTLTLTQAVTRFPVSVDVHVESASARAAPLHQASGDAFTYAPAGSFAWLSIVHSNCSSWNDFSVYAPITDSSAGTVTDRAMTVAVQFGNPCSSPQGQGQIPAGTVTIRAGVHVWASLGDSLFQDRGTAESHVRATVTAMTAGVFTPPEPRTETATYGLPEPAHDCPTTFYGLARCFAVDDSYTTVRSVKVQDLSGLKTAFSVQFLDADGYTLNYDTDYWQAVVCGATASSIPIPSGTRYVLVDPSDRYWLSYGTAPKCRGLKGTSGTITIDLT